MNIVLAIFAIIAVSLIFAVAAWAGPKAIRAIYPEKQHERMIKMHRIMVIVAIIVGFLGIASAVLVLVFTQSSSG